MRRYDRYKTSGIDWIGELPAHWTLKKFKSISYMKGRIGWQGLKQSEFIEEGPYLITGMNFKDGIIRWEEVYHISQERFDEAPEIQLQEGDVLMTKDGTIGKLLYIDYLPGPCSLNSHLLLLRPLNHSYIPRYLYYQLQSQPFLRYVELRKTGTTFFGITQEAVGEYRMILPPKSEQIKVAEYLDEKTSLIDSAISKKQQLIQLLQEERTAIINQAVTRGLDPNVKMKDSGVEWLGEVPAHWEVKSIKHVSKIFGRIGFRGYTIQDIVQKGEGAISLSPANIKQNSLVLDAGTYISWAKYEESPEIIINKGDVVFVKTGSTIGKVALIGELSEPMTLNPQMVVFKQIEVVPEFLYFTLQTRYVKAHLDINMIGGAATTISQEKLNNLKLPVPPANEQVKIVENIRALNGTLTTLSERIEDEIALLQEYRASLINEVVTGKICVFNESEVQAQQLTEELLS